MPRLTLHLRIVVALLRRRTMYSCGGSELDPISKLYIQGGPPPLVISRVIRVLSWVIRILNWVTSPLTTVSIVGGPPSL